MSSTSFAPVEPESKAQVLNRAMAQPLSRIAGALSLMYTVLAIGHWYSMNGAARDTMTAFAVGTAIAMACLAGVLALSKAPARFSHAIGTIIAIGVLANSLLHVGATGEVKHATNVAPVTVGVGCFFFRVRWWIAMQILVASAASIVCYRTLANPDWLHIGFVQFLALVLSAMVLFVRRSYVLGTARALHQLELHRQELKSTLEENSALIFKDSLTGLQNRRGFDRTIHQEFDRARRNGSELSVLMIDIDCFKQYNDYYGHQRGDECLFNVAALIGKAARRPADSAARYGGEEFTLILPETPLAGAGVVAEKLLGSIQDAALPHAASSVGSEVTVSIGMASTAGGVDETAESLIAGADRALYAAKNAGRNRVCSLQTDPSQTVSNQQEI